MNKMHFDFCSSVPFPNMQFARRINGAKSFSELQKVVAQAKACNELRDNVLYSAIKKLDSKECKNVRLGHELARQVPITTLPLLDVFTLGSILNCASQAYDFTLSHQVFRLIRNPRSYDFYYYVNSFKNAKANELTPEMIDELGSLWRKVEHSGSIGNNKLLNQLFSVLSFSKEKQHSLINYLLSKPANISFTCGLLGNFLKYCSKVDNMNLARKVWDWGHSIREKERGTFGYFLISSQYYDMFPPSIAELKSLWSQVRNSGLDYRVELVTSMCKCLSVEVDEQREFIKGVISKEPNESFNFGLLGVFFKHCTETKDLKLARDIWLWGKCIRERSLRDSYNVLVTFQYLTLCESFTNQREFIVNVISNPAPVIYHCGVIGTFLSHCSDQNNLELARSVWSWGLDIRERWKGTSELCHITIQYICISKGSGYLSLLEEVWREAKVFGVGSYKEVLGAFINALAANGAVDRVLELFREFPINLVDEYIVTSTLNALSHAGRDADSLNILRRIQRENPKIVSIISYTSVIDSFARNGNFGMALSLIEEMRQFGIEPNAVTWTTILSPCRFYKNLPVALMAFEELQGVEHEPDDITSAYVLLADTYKSCGDLISYRQLHEERKSQGLIKIRGGVQLCLANCETISFYVNGVPSSLEPQVCSEIYETLDDWRTILKELGLSAESVNCRHSEMLALGYAINVLKLSMKKLRVRLDCHAANVAISKVLRVQITIEDESQVHVIVNGVCSCQGNLRKY